MQAYGYLKKSIELEGKKSDEAVLVTYMQLSNVLYKNKRIDNQDVVNNYMQVSGILEANPASQTEGSLPQKALATIQDIFADSGAADCKILVGIFEPKFKENPNDKDQLKKILAMLERTGCQDSKLFTDASVQLFKIEPSASSAYYLAKVFVKKQDYEKAAGYYNEAINLETDNAKKAGYYYELAAVQSANNQKEMARTNALKAAELRPNWGEPYILIGNLYATSAPSCGANDFEKNAVYWVAVDKYIKAKQVDPDIAEKANEMIKKYSAYFPNKENAFFYGVNDGDTYKVECWINETTTARF
jgi:tetratricopeptide (TPR) repeat protein